MKSKAFILMIAMIMCMTLLGACGNKSDEKDTVSESAIITDKSDIHPEQTEKMIVESITVENTTEKNMTDARFIYVTVGDVTLKANLEENSSADGLLEKLNAGDITVEMSDYANFEKVGSLGFDLPRNDEQYTTKAGDIILYQGNNIVFYYDTNSWNFTKLGEFLDVTQEELMETFGDGSITAKISISE